MGLIIKRLVTSQQLIDWKESFVDHSVQRTEQYYEGCFNENSSGARLTLLAYWNMTIAGCAHVMFDTDYPFFQSNHIPEINDLLVFPEYRKQGIANELLEQLENHVARSHQRVGIGVGLNKDYGAAQRIYCRRGYIPDGHGVIYQNEEVNAGATVTVSDELIFYMVKELN
ncbi:GNAT family N-acetyltransferase [Paenibacillus oenotherae]|uniref:GNAT family N-acetyltransferase n=1 Tax=Paenibacillus oenotherae TaxID=1435645 RepID=A0ABS7D017_9BACL|nr:GNAT family N-acetyltransferase [Paenibacillus oenotherae]MBW7473175.1 GNAT family N-acetyltransferase [Paenibacillus oenotherae]